MPDQFKTAAKLLERRSHVKQFPECRTTPDKNIRAGLPVSLHKARRPPAFTVALKSLGLRKAAPLSVPTRLGPTPHMVFLFISSQFCPKRRTERFLRPHPHG